ncbi:hypothetical protein [Paenibacillus sacheonensis]|uniref:Uncharacterized protein n=1 Tax=Paenibacillus sacheonensis TaxID=742054 RepID=A0A7X4YUV5_9BACL|nr:hypothetical protein [Paenibacillus sacheonensis]MBM7569167.1 outer membrane murein-binding lipoprotein Lpp [Paenibacillus sacheonensis]NBC72997.1 hypothetical protein [Paenibacillus sacheonensis]
MKRIIIIFLALITMLGVVGCSNNEKIDATSAIREVAWNDLTENQKKTVVGNWKSANVEEASLREITAVDPDNGELPTKVDHLYKVIFKTKGDAMLGPIVAYRW